MTTTEALRKQAKKYIDKADEKSLRKINSILEQAKDREWWNDKEFVKELDRMDAAMESGTEKGVTIEELKNSIEVTRLKLYGK